VDPPIAPGRILIRQTKDQRDRASRKARSSRPSVSVGPLLSHQIPMPTQQRLELDKEPSSASSRQKPAQSSGYCSIRWLQGRTRHLSAQDGDLVAEHDDLDRQLLLASTGQADQLEETDEGQVAEGERHAPSSSLEPPPMKVQVYESGWHFRHPHVLGSPSRRCSPSRLVAPWRTSPVIEVG
jgi:hypothetical protein